MAGWLSQIKSGSKSSIGCANLWALILAIDSDFERKVSNYDALDLDHMPLDVHIMADIMTILHYAVSFDFYSNKSIQNTKKMRTLLVRKGPELFSLLFDDSQKWMFPSVEILSASDMAIDVAELLGIGVNRALDCVLKVEAIYKESIDGPKRKKVRRLICDMFNTHALQAEPLQYILINLLETWMLNKYVIAYF